MENSILDLKIIATKIRIDIIKMLNLAGSGHPGGSLSCVEILVALFWEKIKRTPENALDPDRDRFILSKGHGVPALYAVLAHRGVIPYEEIFTLRKINSRLQGHPSRIDLPYVEASTGSLGQGLSIAQGLALAGKLDRKNYRVYCLLGDGEMQEGQVWEAIMSAPKFKLDNLCAIVDYNKGQIDGYVKDVMDIEPLVDKLRAFNWNVIEIDGHDFEQILSALDEAEIVKGKPTFIVAHTVKGKGVSFMEDNHEWHGKAPNDEETQLALKELEEQLNELLSQKVEVK